MNHRGPRPLYQTDQDAKRIQMVLDLRTAQRDQANRRNELLMFVVLVLLVIVVGIAA